MSEPLPFTVSSDTHVILTAESAQNYEHTLLKEYDFCQRDGHVLEANIWQSAAVFVSLSLAGISFLSTQVLRGWSDFALRCTVSLISISVLVIWRRILKRWYYIRAVWYYRMTEIEQRLGMWRERYLQYLNLVRSGTFNPADEEEEHLRTMYKSLSGQRVAPTRQSIDRIIKLLIATWVVFLAYSMREVMRTPAAASAKAAIAQLLASVTSFRIG